MKKIILSLALTLAALPFMAQAQTDFQKGTVQTATNETLEGTIRDQTKNKGTIVFESAGRKKIYTPAEIAGFTMNGANYVSFASDFYKVASPAGKAVLYQRVTDNSGKMLYNGAEVVSVTTAEGKANDFYVQVKSNGQLVLISQKNFEASALAAFADCASVVAEIKAKQIAYADLVKLVEHYNSCK